MADERFNVDITAKDATSAVVEGVTERMAKLGHEVERVETHIHGIHQPHIWNELHEHVTLLHESFGGLRLSLGEVISQAYELVPALAGMTGAVGLEKLFETTEETSERFAVLGHQAEKIGTTAERLNDLHAMAMMTDTSVEGLDVALGKMNVTMGQVMAHGNKEAASLFAHLRIDPHQFHDSTEALIRFGDVFQKTSKMKGGVEVEAHMARTLLGRGGEELIPTLNHGSAWIKEHLEEAHKHNFTPDKEQGEAMEHYNESMKGLKASVQGLHDAIGAKLAPVLLPVIDGMDRWVLANREWMATAITSDVKILGDTLSAVDWHEIGQGVRWFAGGIDEVVENTTGWQRLLEGMAAYWTVSKMVSVFGEPVMKFKEIGENAVVLGGKLYELATRWDWVAESAGKAAAVEEAAVHVTPVASAEAMAAANGATHVAQAGATAETLAAANGAAHLAQSDATQETMAKAAQTAPVAEVAAGAAGATMIGRVAGAGRFAARALMGPELGTAVLAHWMDSDDAVGKWIDSHVPGTAAVDDWFARHTQGAVGRLMPAPPPAAPADRRPSPGSGGPEDDWGLPFVYSHVPPAQAFAPPAFLPLMPPQEAPRLADPARVDGDIRVSIELAGAPPGTRTSTEVAGSDMLSAHVNLGQSWPTNF